jgi:co-chaperonin GroES (HSP10)
MHQVPLEVEVDEEVAYGEYAGDEGEADDDLLD